jgi:homopolymeric O-antigen transport system permease protein
MAQDAVRDMSPTPAAPTWRIEPAPPSIVGQLRAVWRHRHLFWPLTVRALFDIYRTAILGIAWMAVHPLVIAIPAAFIVGDVFGVSVDPLPLPLFILAGMAIWTLFRRSVQWMTKSLAKNQSILQRVYVPALLLLIAAVSPGLFEFSVVLALVVSLAVYYGWIVNIGWQLLAVVPAMLMTILLAIGLSCITAILNAFARDTWLTLRYVLSAWMLASPILYPTAVIPAQYRWMIYLNPLTPIVELFRWGLLGYGTVQWAYVGLAAAEILIVLLAGIWFFARQQNRLFDHM